MKKTSKEKPEIKENKLDIFKQLLDNAGFRIDDFDSSPTEWHYAADDRFFIRYHSEKIEIGIKKCFHRWTNSVDFWTRKIPQNIEELSILLATVERLIEIKLFSTEWGQQIDVEEDCRATRIKRTMDYAAKHYGNLMRRLSDSCSNYY